jgi:soluble lytic murein transglycosylase
MKKLLLILPLIYLPLFAKIHTLKEITTMPQSISKDFYIWRFITESNTTKEASLNAYQQSLRKSYKLKKAIRQKLGYLPKEKTKNAKDPKNFIIYPKTASKKTLTSLKRLYQKVKKKGKYSTVLKVMTNRDPFEALKKESPKTQCYIFNQVTHRYRLRYFDHPFSKEQLDLLSNEPQFNQTIHTIITQRGMKQIKKSLLNTPITEKINFQNRFLLSLNALKEGNISQATNYLDSAKSIAKFQSQKDQCNFWFYLINRDQKHLESVIQSTQVNLYTLAAREIMHQPHPKVITPHLPMRFVTDFDLHNPIDWEKIKRDIKEKSSDYIDQKANSYKSYLTEGVYSYLKEKASGYTLPYYAMPYLDAMIGKPKERIALLYAIARQESRFVPASISSSYALGMMQIMPFLIKHLASKRGENLDLEEMFDPYIAISYADQHLDYLTKYLYHPLFIAYGYNGGIGFTKKTIKQPHLFKKGAYEPYLSMELINYEESKEYAKKVLSNYVIYMNLLGEKQKILPLLEELSDPLATDRFR